MSIFGVTDNIKSDIVQREDESLVPVYDSDRVDTKFISTLPGYNWEVTYLHRKLSQTDLATQYDSELDLTIQEFIKINKLNLKVAAPLETGSIDGLQGSAIIDVNIVPTFNDLIITKLPDGRILVLVVTNISRVNYNNENLYNIEYISYNAFTDINDPEYTSILNAIVEEFTYNKDYRISSTKPLYSIDELSIRNDRLADISRLYDYWGSTFINMDNNYYICYIDDLYKVYDPFMEKFILDVFGSGSLSNDAELLLVKTNNISILDFTNNSDIEIMRVVKYLDYEASYSLGTNPHFKPIYFTGVNRVITIRKEQDPDIEVISNDTIVNELFPNIDNVTYIFREVVYDILSGKVTDVDITTLTKFEQLYIEMMTGNILHNDDITVCYNEIYNLPKKEQFYFIPILMYIIKYYLTTFTVKYV